MEKITIERLLKVGSFSELFGLITGYRIERVIEKIKIWGLNDSKMWTAEGIEAILSPYRNHVRQQSLSEKTIDSALHSFAEATGTDINLVRRAFYQIAEVSKQIAEKRSTEIINEAENDLPEFGTDEEESEGVEAE